MAEKGEELVLWTRADSDEVLKIVFNETAGSPLPALRAYDDDGVKLAYTTAGATARSGTTLGKGTATLRWLNTSGTDRTIQTTTDEVNYFNLATEAVGSAKYILLRRLGADWICIWEECSA